MPTETQNKKDIKLWTAQAQVVVDTIKEKGIYQVKKEFIKQKYGDVAHIFLEAYNWYVRQAEKIVSKPSGAEYPVWMDPDPNYLDCSGQGWVIELTVDRDKVITFDRKKWNKILNLAYIPENEEDAEEHKEELERYNLNNDSEAYLSPHYPHLKSKIKNSWTRLFDESIRLSKVDRASLWQIKEDWVEDMRRME
jgi:hypothetical protein